MIKKKQHFGLSKKSVKTYFVDPLPNTSVQLYKNFLKKHSELCKKFKKKKT